MITRLPPARNGSLVLCGGNPYTVRTDSAKHVKQLGMLLITVEDLMPNCTGLMLPRQVTDVRHAVILRTYANI